MRCEHLLEQLRAGRPAGSSRTRRPRRASARGGGAPCRGRRRRARSRWRAGTTSCRRASGLPAGSRPRFMFDAICSSPIDVEVVDRGRLRVVAHLRRIAGDDDEVADADGVRAEQVRHLRRAGSGRARRRAGSARCRSRSSSSEQNAMFDMRAMARGPSAMLTMSTPLSSSIFDALERGFGDRGRARGSPRPRPRTCPPRSSRRRRSARRAASARRRQGTLGRGDRARTRPISAWRRRRACAPTSPSSGRARASCRSSRRPCARRPGSMRRAKTSKYSGVAM